ncbi:STAS/SEC14 domain-containing protein [Hymenobacter lapidiphilus]|uniref:STAS/SEC14 domain-containing protein n=1 Tax=Hymenobacter lapidiphilus TaxID=2608003 RepID=A0A7Y7U830_9BACT|nr:STAS/SEC14 domain-containing protein [Hymenobacter lapidiphilus]NVO33434.1 STAS/SEC14 domain-containing protein [Hymenobacter lapidiphilus]
MKLELKSSLGRPYITVEDDTANRWIAVDWVGYLTADSIQAGAQAYTSALAEAGFQCVLNDTRKVIGPWDHSLEWVLNEWAPNAAAAGLRYFAMVTTPDSLADESAQTFYAQLKAFEVKMFSDDEAARQWLQQCNAK